MIKQFLTTALGKYTSKWLVLAIDIFLVCLSFVFSYFVKFNASLNFDLEDLLFQLPLIIVMAFFSFLIVGSHKGFIRYTGIKDVFNVFLGISLLAILISLFVFINLKIELLTQFTIPISIIIIHYLINILILIFSRFIFKAFYEIISSEVGKVKNTMIYGAGDSGLITYAALNKDTQIRYNVLGFIDDDFNKVNKKINRIRIYSLDKITNDFIKKNRIDEIIISIQNVKASRLLEITDYFIDFDVNVKIVPPLTSWIDGDLKANQIRDVKIEDLLDREPILIENPILQQDINDKVILVTGAAGSIGSEISRQLCKYKYKYLILIDQAESSLYDLQQELIQQGIINFKVIVADIRDEERMECIFKEYQPQKVFHAAAYKHVPLMEESPYEAVKINVIGTKIIADLSLKHEVERFVMVSTDKAVNPTNVMGATKRVAEIYIGCLSVNSDITKFTITRFGNVLGSNGSVIPLFKKQIENGGPLTVTHKDITRYFMTIPEACRLVLEAGTMGDGGEIYIFDMGKSVKIFEIAKKMIDLSGLKYPDDIDIVITGLRPGEKLYEELLTNGENTIPTYHNKIMIAKTERIDVNTNLSLIKELQKQNDMLDKNKTVCNIKKIVPEYISNNSIYEKLDK